MKKIFIGATFTLLCLSADNAKAQTRFQVPDTTPNYLEYRYVDECLSAVRRMMFQDSKKEVFWTDTLPPDSLFKVEPMSEETRKNGRFCLQKVNLDTISIGTSLTLSKEKAISELIQILLMVGRNEDVMTLIKRLLDSAHNEAEWSKINSLAFLAYRSDKNVEGFKHLLKIVNYSNLPEDRLKDHRVYTSLAIGEAAMSKGDTLLAKQQIAEVIRMLSEDTLRQMAAWKDRYFVRDGFTLAYEALIDQGMDSLKISNQAYRSYLENIFSKFTDWPLSVTGDVVGEKAPLVTGKYWYKNGWTVSADGKVEFSDQVTKIDSQQVPVPGKINALLLIQSARCHAASYRPMIFGRNDGSSGKDGNNRGVCWESASMINRLKKEFPELEVTVLTRTFGSMGGSGPLPSEQEAALVSSYLLGFYKIPGINAISETEFFRLPDMDRRRIDLPVGYQKDYLGLLGDIHPTDPPSGVVVLIDDKGEIFHNTVSPRARDREELILRKKLAAAFSRLKSK